MARLIPLTQDKQTAVSKQDYRAIMAFAPWYYDGGYAVRMTPRPNRQKLYMHRLIAQLRGDSPRMEVDHHNHDGLDNRRRNLRPATRRQQRQTVAKQKDSYLKVSVGILGIKFTLHKSVPDISEHIKQPERLTALIVVRPNAYLATLPVKDKQ